MSRKLFLAKVLLCSIVTNAVGQTLDSNYFNQLKTAQVSSSSLLNWTQVGPGNSGYCDAFFIHPTDDNTMFMSPDMDNSYVSTDDGVSWNSLKDNDGTGDLMREFTSIDFSRQNANLGFAVDVRGRLMKTLDKGKNWSQISSFPATSRQASLTVDPTNDNIWYIGGGDFFNIKDNHRNLAMLNNRDLSYQYPYAEYGNIYKTTDKGVTWIKINGTASGLPDKVNIGKIFVYPNNHNTLIIATSHGVFRSFNAGLTWTLVGAGLPNNMPRDMVARIESGVYTLYCVDQTNYVSVGSGANRTVQSTGGVYKSINNGGNWTNVTGDLGIDLTQITSSNTKSKYYRTIAYWFGITEAVAKTTYPKLPTNILPVFNRIVVDPSNTTRIYVAHNTKHDYSFGPGDIWSTNNSGTNWAPVMRTGLYWNNGTDASYWSTKGSTGSNATFAHIQPEIDRREEMNGNRFLAIDSRGYVYGSVDQQTFRSTNNGISWQQRDDVQSGEGWKGRGNSNMPGRSIVMETGVTGIYLFASGEHGLWKSTSASAPLYVKQIEGQKNEDASTSIASVAVHPTNPNIIYTMQFRQEHRGELRKSTDGGITWSTVSFPLPTTGTNVSSSDQILNHSLTIDHQNPAKMYFNTLGTPINEVFGTGAPFSAHGVYKSINSGVTWTRSNGTGSNVLPLNGSTVNRIKMDPTTATTLYASCVQSADKLTDGGLYKSTDSGTNWVKMTIPSEIKSVNHVFIQQKSGTNNLYISCGTFTGAANEGGVWKSTNNGTSWNKIFDLPYVWYTEVSKLNSNIITVAAAAQDVKKTNLNVLNPGAYISFDNGSSWMKANKNLGQPHKINELRPDFSNQNIFWCSLQGSGWTRGVYSGIIAKSNTSEKQLLDESPQTENSKIVSIYPNPVKDNCTVKLNFNDNSTKATISIYSINGQKELEIKTIIKQNDATSVNINSSALSPGVYIMNIKTDNEEYIKRLIKI
ncbi:T9SS type A sorting domain-containing protein [Flavobacterium sp.]|uniref:T9SS type A sorting domain-containing protein n=1 Tax=Flavobacterium sp. TaxID=239 RepID=UPI003C554005